MPSKVLAASATGHGQSMGLCSRVFAVTVCDHITPVQVDPWSSCRASRPDVLQCVSGRPRIPVGTGQVSHDIPGACCSQLHACASPYALHTSSSVQGTHAAPSWTALSCKDEVCIAPQRSVHDVHRSSTPCEPILRSANRSRQGHGILCCKAQHRPMGPHAWTSTRYGGQHASRAGNCYSLICESGPNLHCHPAERPSQGL